MRAKGVAITKKNNNLDLHNLSETFDWSHSTDKMSFLFWKNTVHTVIYICKNLLQTFFFNQKIQGKQMFARNWDYAEYSHKQMHWETTQWISTKSEMKYKKHLRAIKAQSQNKSCFSFRFMS